MAYDRCLIYQGSSPRGRSKRQQSGSRTNKRGLNTKIHLAVASFGMPVRIVVTDGIDADYLLADRGGKNGSSNTAEEKSQKASSI